MLPLYLSIEGLYSYQEKQEIDFTLLTEAGLFGIFGAVGSGKSSILEAISFSLYGDTERLNKADKRAYNMLNLKSNGATIVFDFLNFQQRKFRFVAHWKRRKRFEDITPIERLAYEWKEGQWIPMESADGALVTNLSYPNFRRTIIIPQGKFKEFLELGGKDRSEMMKEIFYLNKYDLGPKVSFLQAENNKKLENLRGALTGFEEVTSAILESKKITLNEARSSLLDVKEEHKSIEERYQKLVNIQQDKKDLANKELALAALEQQSDSIKKMEEEISQFEKTVSNFKEALNVLHQLTTGKEALVIKIQNLKEQKLRLQHELAANEEKFAHVSSDFDRIDVFKKQIEDYKLLITNSKLENKKAEVQNRLEKGQPIVRETKEKETLLIRDLEEEENKLEILKNARMDTSILLAIENWYQFKDNIEKSTKDLRSKFELNQSQIHELENQFQDVQLNVESWEKQLQLAIQECQKKLSDLAKEESDWRLKQELSQYVQNLHDGESCPLCGSLDHPAPMHAEDVTIHLNEVLNLKTELQREELANNRKIQQFTKTATLLADKIKLRAELKNELTIYAEKLESHDKEFKWLEFDSTDRSLFNTKKKTLQGLENDIKQKEIRIKELREATITTREKVLRYEKSLAALDNEIKMLESNIQQNTSQLRILNINEPPQIPTEQYPTIVAEIQQKIVHTEEEYQVLNKSINELHSKIASISGQYVESYEHYTMVSTQLGEIQSKINTLLASFGYNDITEVQFVINKNLPVDQYKMKIQNHYIQISALRNRIMELKNVADKSEFTDQLFEETETLFRLKKEELELQLTLTGALEKEFQHLLTEFEKKTTLLAEFEKVNIRKENLETLAKMFKGNGFVNYVSSIHLERLCEIANQRFHRLTKNQLSLSINESNEFEVIDFLNNGYRRSVKTLSGGQGFQASLCLALALAENIQSMNKADKNFFFIDEGFGTQDNESINTVFDTLQYLHQENRVVGIISHVEELKERMPRAITVIKDIEKGSVINNTY
ncbi:SMC family ATPase [Sphingobacterium alkalisoli]|uniref:SMC family ATPase n=1 Tax=Sphingobacterium alkalisoli TaxID=1874115 RepID=A0A4V5LXR2_9SPHI|nr:SMC family ATPase [Sphingobacterium alkalisoli]TJY63579.1 SMC family ATPase [Sphingobacterium alkalisoli]GGH26959.1 nuclease SbcCD subunit C [Sphingobacterium alkalisoli]